MALFSGWFVQPRRGGRPPRRRRPPQWLWARLALVGALAGVGLAGSGLIAAASSHTATTRISVLNGTDDGEATTGGRTSSVSADGRFVAFESASADLTGRTDEGREILLRDRQTLSTRVVSLTPGGGRFDGSSRGPSISADGTRVAFHAWGNNDNLLAFAQGGDIWIANANGSNPRNLTGAMATPGVESHPSISPDGTRVAFERSDDDGVHIWVVDIATLTTTRVTDHSEPGEETRTDHTPSWSHDAGGTQIVFFTIYADLNESYIHTVAATGGAIDIVTELDYDPGDTWLAYPDWSPTNNDLILFSHPGDAGGLRLSTVTVSDNMRSSLTGDDADTLDTAAEWAPNGSQLVFQRTTLSPDSETHAFLLSYPVTEFTVPVQLTEESGSDLEPTFNPDGSLVAFAGNRPPDDPQRGLFTIPPDADPGEGPVALLHAGEADSPHYGITNPNPEQDNVYVHDTTTGTTVLASVGMAGEHANDNSANAALSADGLRVAFESDATNLTADDPWGATNIFLRDLPASSTRMVSIHPLCDSPPCTTRDSLNPSVSVDGGVVAFHSAAPASGLVAFYPGDPAEPYTDDEDEGVTQVFVRDMAQDHYTIESLRAAGGEGFDSSYDPSLSGDGARVAFTSEADLMSEDISDPNIYVRDRAAAQTLLVSVDSAGNHGNDQSLEPSISGDGRSVAFASAASNLVPDDGNGGSTCGTSEPCPGHDIFLHDIARAVTERVSLTADGAEATDAGGPPDSRRPAVSANGRFVSFDSTADNLVPDDTNESVDVFLRDRVPVLTITPDPLDFGELPVGGASTPLVATVVNTGSGPVTISAITTGGAAAGDYAIAPSSCLGATLFSGESCTIAVTFTPTTSGPREAQLVVNSDAPLDPVTIGLTGRGAPPGFGALELTPDPVDFGEQEMATASGPRVATAISIGTAAVTISSVVLEGVDPTAFSFSAPGADTCTGASLPPASGCQVTLIFQPDREGPHHAVLTVTSTAVGSPHSIAVTGVGIDSRRALLEVTPDPADFGEHPEGTASPPLVVTGISIGQLPVQIVDVQIDGPDSSAFSFTAPALETCTGALLNPGEGCQVTLTFVPQRPGVHTADLVINNSAEDAPHRVRLTGSGEQEEPGPGPGPGPGPSPGPTPPDGAALRVTPRPAEFGYAPAGEPGGRRTLTATNIGQTALEVSEVSVDSDVLPPDFRILRRGEGCSGTVLDPGDSCRLRVQFLPRDTGVRTARLRVETVENVEGTTRLRGSAPQLRVDPPLGRPGFPPTITGRFFPPDRQLRLVWRPGLGEVTVRTNARGRFETQLLVIRRDRTGPRTVRVRGLGLDVFDRYLVVPGSLQPPDFTNRS